MTARQLAYIARRAETGARQRGYLLDAETLEALAELRERWRCSEVEVVRRAIGAAAANAKAPPA